MPSFLPLIEPDETVWSDLTNSATPEDWQALDLIFFISKIFPDSKLYLAAGNMIGEEVAEQSLEKFGFYVPDEKLLPAFLFENSRLNIRLLSYFKHPKGFGRENLLCDDNTNGCGIISSLSEASQRLQEKLSHYSNQGS